MSYKSGEAKLLTLLRAITPSTWTADNSVSLANDTANFGQVMINRGKSYHYLMLEQGAFMDDYHDIGESSVQAQWQTIITVLVLKETNRGALAVMADDLEAIRNKLNQYARMNAQAGVTLGKLKSGTRRMTERIRVNNKTSIVLFKKELIYQWDEISSVTQLD